MNSDFVMSRVDCPLSLLCVDMKRIMRSMEGQLTTF